MAKHSVETRSDQFAYPGQMGHVFSGLCELPDQPDQSVLYFMWFLHTCTCCILKITHCLLTLKMFQYAS